VHLSHAKPGGFQQRQGLPASTHKDTAIEPQKKTTTIGAGPAGLTAAHELLKRTDIGPIRLEKSSYMRGISRTVNYKGNRTDIGGHRFFSGTTNGGRSTCPCSAFPSTATGMATATASRSRITTRPATWQHPRMAPIPQAKTA
jgi:hypothetical protein